MEPIRRQRQPRPRQTANRAILFTAFADEELTDLQQASSLRDASASFSGTEHTHYHAQLERATTTNRIHLQAYFRSIAPRTLSAWKTLLGRFFPKPPSIRFATGGIDSNIDYTSKDDTRINEPDLQYSIHDGAREKRGKRNDLLKAVKAVMEDPQVHALADTNLNPATMCLGVKYPNALRALNEKKLRDAHDRNTAPTVLLLKGSTGTGKTKFAYDHFADHLWSAPISSSSSAWFDGYSGQPVILFDDVDCDSALRLATFKRVLDRYPISVPVKGGFTLWVPKLIIITTNDDDPFPTWFPNAKPAHIAALTRRVPLIVDTDAANWCTQLPVVAFAANAF